MRVAEAHQSHLRCWSMLAASELQHWWSSWLPGKLQGTSCLMSFTSWKPLHAQWRATACCIWCCYTVKDSMYHHPRQPWDSIWTGNTWRFVSVECLIRFPQICLPNKENPAKCESGASLFAIKESLTSTCWCTILKCLSTFTLLWCTFCSQPSCCF